MQPGEGGKREMKEKAWPVVSACHARMLGDHRTPVGSGRFRDHAQDPRGVLGMSFSSSLTLDQVGCAAHTHGTRLGWKSHFLLNKAATGNKLEKHPGRQEKSPLCSSFTPISSVRGTDVPWSHYRMIIISTS